MRIAAMWLSVAACAAPAFAGGNEAPVVVPLEKQEPVKIGTFETRPVIDGKLDEEVWKSAAVLKDFYQIQPGDNIAPTQRTEVLMAKDATTLYIAYRCYDSEPNKVRATIPKRDQIFEDDYVGIYLDTFQDQRRAYALFFNPFGVQADGIYTEDRGEDYSFDLVMDSKGEVTAEGYTIEIAIPFKSLRYHSGEGKTWGVQLFRRDARRAELTPAGHSYFPAIRDAFDRIDTETRTLRPPALDNELTVQVYVTVALKWLIPRLHDFERRYPDMKVRLSTSYFDWDFDEKNVDAGLILARGRSPDNARTAGKNASSAP